MAQDFSFDISCSFDKQEFQNAIDQTRREIGNRFDFNGVFAEIEIVNNEKLILQTESEHKLNALIDIIESKLIKRNLSLSILDKTKPSETASGGNARKEIKLVNTLNSDQTKDIAKFIRQDFPKAKPIIQGDSVRVTSRSKDELQSIMHLLKEKRSDLPLDFVNFK